MTSGTNPKLRDVVLSSWLNISPTLEGQLKHWAKFNFGSIKLKKLALLHEIEFLDSSKESRTLTLEELTKEASLKLEPGDLLKQKRNLFETKCKSNWLREGDERR